jgi:hypothetical protein
MRLFDCCRTDISRFSCDACSCHKKSKRSVHSTCRPCVNTAIMKMTMRAKDIMCNGTDELRDQNKSRSMLIEKLRSRVIEVAYVTRLS